MSSVLYFVVIFILKTCLIIKNHSYCRQKGIYNGNTGGEKSTSVFTFIMFLNMIPAQES